MKLRFWILLLAMSGCLAGSPILAEDSPGTPKGSWALDFWPRWPKPTGGVTDCFASAWTDALARGYFVDPRSISPDRRYAVIVPRFGVVREGPNFIVELNLRRVVGVVGGPGFAFEKKAEAGWRYTWAPDSASLVIEQTGEFKKDWARVGWRLIELRDGFIAREIDLLKNPGKAPAWLDTKEPPTHERSEPVADGSPAVLAWVSVSCCLASRRGTRTGRARPWRRHSICPSEATGGGAGLV